MMVKCLCINDGNRPEMVPPEKWVVSGEFYRISFITVCLPQKVLAFSLYEKPLGESFYPYEFFAAERFLIPIEDANRFNEYLSLCNEVSSIPVEQLIESFRLGR